MGRIFWLAKFTLLVLSMDSSIAAAFVCDHNRNDYFCVEVGSVNANSTTEKDYLNDTKVISKLFSTEIQKRFQRAFVIPNFWNSPFFGGGAQLLESDLDYGGNPTAKIVFFGGTMRTKSAKGLSFLTGLCHEVGHFLANGPKQNFVGAQWSAIEGAADFYAALNCLPKIFLSDSERLRREAEFEDKIIEFCQSNLLCANVVQAGYEMVNLFRESAFGEQLPEIQVKFQEPKAQTVTLGYPNLQCRFESFLKAGTCIRQGRVATCLPPSCWYPVR